MDNKWKGLGIIIKPTESYPNFNEPFPFDVDSWQSVKKAKKRLGDILRAPSFAVHLIFNGRELKDESTFADQSVGENSVVRVKIAL